MYDLLKVHYPGKESHTSVILRPGKCCVEWHYGTIWVQFPALLHNREWRKWWRTLKQTHPIVHFDPIRTQIRGQPQSCHSTQSESVLSGPVWTYPFWSENSHFSVECALRSRVLEIRVIKKRDFLTTPHSIDFRWTKSFTAQLSTPLHESYVWKSIYFFDVFNILEMLRNY